MTLYALCFDTFCFWHFIIMTLLTLYTNNVLQKLEGLKRVCLKQNVSKQNASKIKASEPKCVKWQKCQKKKVSIAKDINLKKLQRLKRQKQNALKNKSIKSKIASRDKCVKSKMRQKLKKFTLYANNMLHKWHVMQMTTYILEGVKAQSYCFFKTDFKIIFGTFFDKLNDQTKFFLDK